MRLESGFTLIELLVAMALFAAVSAGFYQVLFSTTRASDASSEIAAVSAEARVGMNRMLGDVRHAFEVSRATGDLLYIQSDLDGDGNTAEAPPDSTGYEYIGFAFDGSAIAIRGLDAAANVLIEEMLVEGVDCLRTPEGACARPVFSYTGGDLSYDWDQDGVTTGAEIDAATPAMASAPCPCSDVGNGNGILDIPSELEQVGSVDVAFRVVAGETATELHARIALRNAS